MKKYVIVNRSSGAAEVHADEIQRMAQSCAQCQALVLGAPLDIDEVRETIHRAAGYGCQRIIVAGGDGTVSQVASILVQSFSEVELALLPLGTGNDFARSLGITPNNLDLAWQQAIEGVACPVDVGEAAWSDGDNRFQSYFLNMAHGALSGLVAHDVASDDKSRWGAFAYWMTALGRLVDARDYEICVELAEQVIDLRAYGVLIANGRYVGGGFPAAPHAQLDDGLFDVVIIPVLPTLNLVGAGLDFWMGSEQLDERIKIVRSESLLIRGREAIPFSIDGETTTAATASFRILPQALRCVVGENPPAFDEGI